MTQSSAMDGSGPSFAWRAAHSSSLRPSRSSFEPSRTRWPRYHPRPAMSGQSSRTSSASSRSSRTSLGGRADRRGRLGLDEGQGCRAGAAGDRSRARLRDDVHDRHRHRLQHAPARRRAAAGRDRVAWSNEILHVVAPLFLLVDLLLRAAAARTALVDGLDHRDLPDRVGRLHAGPRDPSSPRRRRAPPPGTRTRSSTRTCRAVTCGVVVYVVAIAAAVVAVGLPRHLGGPPACGEPPNAVAAIAA